MRHMMRINLLFKKIGGSVPDDKRVAVQDAIRRILEGRAKRRGGPGFPLDNDVVDMYDKRLALCEEFGIEPTLLEAVFDVPEVRALLVEEGRLGEEDEEQEQEQEDQEDDEDEDHEDEDDEDEARDRDRDSDYRPGSEDIYGLDEAGFVREIKAIRSECHAIRTAVASSASTITSVLRWNTLVVTGVGSVVAAIGYVLSLAHRDLIREDLRVAYCAARAAWARWSTVF